MVTTKWIKPEPTDSETSDQRVLKCIGELFQYSGGIYGAPRIHQELKREGICIGCKRVARLMREYNSFPRSRVSVDQGYRRSVGARQIKARGFGKAVTFLTKKAANFTKPVFEA